jgi:hypothetical protein
MADRFVDLENGNDLNNGLSYANRKKSIESALASSSSGDVIRVMASEDPVSIGVCQWRKGEKFSTMEIRNIYDYGGQVAISFPLGFDNFQRVYYWIVDDWVSISGCGKFPELNGKWKISLVFKQGNSTFITLDKDYSELTDTSLFDYGTITNISSETVVADTLLIDEITPTWSSYVVSSPLSAWMKNSGIDGVTNGSAFVNGSQPPGEDIVSGNSYFEPRPGSSWRITWLASSLVNVTEVPYVDTRSQMASGTSNYFSSYSGYDNSVAYFYTNYAHQIAGSNWYYGYISSNSLMQFGSSYMYSTTFYANSPYYRGYRIGSGDHSCNYLRNKGNISDPAYSDIGGNVTIALFQGHVRNAPGTTYANVPFTLEWEAVFFQYSSQTIQFNIHANDQWQYVTLQPGTSVVDGKSGLGTRFIMSGSPANTYIHWSNFASPIDLSSRDTLSFFIKNDSGSMIGKDIKIRLHEGTYNGGGNFVEFDLPSDIGSDWTAFSLESPSGNFSNSVGAISIYNNGSEIGEALEFSISNLIAVSSTGIKYDSLVGINTSGDPFWYKIGTLSAHSGKTFIGLGKYGTDSETTSYSLSYLGSIGSSPITIGHYDLETYIRKPIRVSPISLYSEANDKDIIGGWDRTDMLSVTGETFLTVSSTDFPAFSCVSPVGMNLQNIHTYGGNKGLYVTNGSHCFIKNCSFNYSYNDGIELRSAEHLSFKNVSSLANNRGIYFYESSDNRIENGLFECNRAGIYRDRGSWATDTINSHVRGSAGAGAIVMNSCACIRDYNLYVVNCYGTMFDIDELEDYQFSKGYIRRSIEYISNTHVIETNGEYRNIGWIDVTPFSLSHTSTLFKCGEAFTVTQTSTNGKSFDKWYYLPGIRRIEMGTNVYTSFGTGFSWDDQSTAGRVYKFESYNYDDYGRDAYDSAVPKMKLASIPVSEGTNFSVSIRTFYPSSFSNHNLTLYLDAAESSIGLDDNIVVDCYGHTYNTWQQYTLNVTAIESGVAHVYVSYWGNGSSGSNTIAYLGDIQISEQ